MNYTKGPWKVMPCPVNKGKHPFHDTRWIATEDAEVEYAPYVDGQWALETGSLICEMRDSFDRGNAHLIAAAPVMYEALKELYKQCAMIHKYGGEIYNQKESNEAIRMGLDAIKKAEGGD